MADLDIARSPLDSLTEAVATRLERADTLWRSGEGARSDEALAACDEALALLASAVNAEGSDVTGDARARLEAAAWLKRGHLLEVRAAGGGETLIEALRGYDRAVALLQKPGSADADATLLAGAWMNRGNVLQRLGSEASRGEAIRSYDRAIALLGGAAPGGGEQEEAARAVTLGAAWLNRGAAAFAGVLAGGAGADAARSEATRSFERAIAELAPPAGTQPAARRNLVSAWTNLGLLRQENRDASGAVAAHEAAWMIAGGAAATGNDLAALGLNLGLARRAAGAPEAALEIFREVVAAVAAREAEDPSAADLGLRARHAACVTIGEQLASERGEATETTRARLAEAAALVEDGLAAARLWAARVGAVGEPGARVFEFGAWLYRSYGEGQLAPYLQAHLEPADPRRVEIAWAAVSLARQEIMQQGFERLMGEAAERAAAELAGLREVEERLRGLAARFAAARPA